MKRLTKIIATVFGIGYFPIAQGTLAGLAGVGLYLLIRNNTFIYLAVLSIILIVGFIVSGKAERIFAEKDSRKIVIDDFSGILIAYLFIPFVTHYIIIGFLIYRMLDIIKLYPINKLEKLPSGWGIMLDDIVAGLYTNLILQVIAKIALC